MDRRERDELDRHITGNYGEDFFEDDEEAEEYDPDCVECGHSLEIHPVVRRTDSDGNDYEVIECP